MAHSFNFQKSFQQKYRVFSAAFWQNNGNSLDLEKSDKIVLPPSALNALTDCNATFPVLLKIQIIDAFTNKPKPSNIFSYVIDYSAPEGLIYMSSWMINKLKLDQSGQSVVELSLPTTNNLKYQCPTAEFLQLQPHSLKLMLLDNVSQLVHASLSEFYSSLRIGDIITVYQQRREYKLSVVKISGKETTYTPKCVRLNHNNTDNLMIGFSEPRNYELDENNNKDKQNEDNIPPQINDDQKQQENKKEEEEENESDGEWEIVSVEKVKSLSDLEWKEPSKPSPPSQQNEDDIKVPIAPKQPSISPSPKEPEPEQKEIPQPIIEPEPHAPNKKKPSPSPEPIIYTEWQCPKCNTINDIAYKFCPKCGCNKDLWKPPSPPKAPKQEESKKSEPVIDKIDESNQEEINQVVLAKVSVINDGVYVPNEDRQTGWIVKNISGKSIDIKAKLVRIGGDSDVHVKHDEVINFQMQPEDEMFILMETKAPAIPNQYHMFYQLVLVKDESKRICDMLNLPVLVKKQFDDQKELKIKKIFQMGFSDRAKIITALKKWNWDVLKAINWLATH